MKRKDLLRARRELPDLNERWHKRRAEMEARLEDSWRMLRRNGRTPDPEASALYRRIARTDRVISFLDRALMHLDDIERDTHHAEGILMAPASSPRAARVPAGHPVGRNGQSGNGRAVHRAQLPR